MLENLGSLGAGVRILSSDVLLVEVWKVHGHNVSWSADSLSCGSCAGTQLAPTWIGFGFVTLGNEPGEGKVGLAFKLQKVLTKQVSKNS